MIFGWVVPIVALWFPKQIVDDIWNTSMPGDLGSGTNPPSLQYARRSGLIWAWWVSWLISMWMSNVAYRVAGNGEEPEDLLATAKVDIYFMVPTLVCAALAVAIVLKITKAQEQQRITYLNQFGYMPSAAPYQPPLG